MKISAVFTAALALAASATAANVVSLPFTKKSIAAHRGLAERSTISDNLANFGLWYMAEVQVGTPPQNLTLTIDTGSTDTWVMTNDTGDYCQTNRFSSTDGNAPANCYGGFFTAADSITYKEIDTDGFFIVYGDGSESSGPFFEDNLSIGGATIKGFQMGLGEVTDEEFGILGLSYDTNEARVQRGATGAHPYPSFIDQLVSQKTINAPVYSLSLDALNATTGSILFGGIDTEKFTGELISVPIIPISNSLFNGSSIDSTDVAFYVSLQSLGLNGAGSDFLAEPVLLDSGTSFMYLPDWLVTPIVEAYNGVFVEEAGMNIVDCNISSIHADDYLEFQFQLAPATVNYTMNTTTITTASGPIIRVPIPEIIVDANTGRAVTAESTECAMGIIGSDDGILGDTFLRSAYAVFDLKNNEIGLAQAFYGSTECSFVEIEANATRLPSLCGNSESSRNAGSATVKSNYTLPRLSASMGGGDITLGGRAAVIYESSAALFSSAPLVLILVSCLAPLTIVVLVAVDGLLLG